MAITVAPKDPNEVLDYTVDWTLRLAGDTISTSTFFLDAADTSLAVIGVMSVLAGNLKTKVWISAGTLDTECHLTNRVVTVGGRTFDQTIKFKLKAK